MVRVAGIKPASRPWEGHILSLKYTRNGADRRNRTADLHFTKVLLYQLSYIGTEMYRQPKPTLRSAPRS